MVEMVPTGKSVNQGVFEVKAGGIMELEKPPTDEGGYSYYKQYIGSSDEAYFKLSEGSMKLGAFNAYGQDTEKLVKAEFTLVENAKAEIPEEQKVTLWLGKGNCGMDLTIQNNAYLDVKGGLRGVSGASYDGQMQPSAFKIDGTLDCTNGVLSLSKKAPVTIGATGKMLIGDKGLIGGSLLTDEGLNTGYAPMNNTPNIKLTPGGSVSVSAGNEKNKNLASQIKSSVQDGGSFGYPDENGNLVIGATDQGIQNAEAIIGTTQYDSLAAAMAAAKSGDTINLLKNADLSTAPNQFVAGAVLAVNKDQTLTIKRAAASLLQKSGIIKISAGGTVKLPNADSQEEAFVGTTDARMNLKAGNIALDLGEKTLTIAENSGVEIPSGKISYTKLNSIGLTTVVEEGAEVTVNGTLKVTSGSTVDLKGTLTVSNGGILTLSKNAGIDVTGKLQLPVMSKDQLKGTADGTGLKGDITIQSGAELQYGSYPVLSQGEDSMIQLGEGSEAVLNMGMADTDKEVIKLDLKKGSSSINKNTKTLLVISDSTAKTVPIAITTAKETTTTLNSTLSLTNGSSLQSDGAFNIEKNGVLEVHSTAAFTGKAAVAGKAYIFDEKDNPAKDATFTLQSGGEVYGNSELTGTTIEPAQVTEGQFEYISISSTDQQPSIFNRQWSYYSAPSVNPGAPSVDVTSITLNKTELTLEAGETEKLTAAVLPENATDKTVTWKSDNEAVAAVAADGTVTAAAEGTANITATAGGKTVTCKVTVTPKGSEVTSISLNKTELTLTAGETEKLTATVLPETAADKTVTWKSDNEAVAAVAADGTVTAAAEGTANITATAGGKTAVCKVTVSPVIEATGITLNKKALVLLPKKTAVLKAGVLPAEAADKTVTWSSSRPSVATVNGQGKVRAVKGGTAVITAKTANGKKAVCKVTVAKISLNAAKLQMKRGTKTSALKVKSRTYTADKIRSVKSSRKNIVKATYKGGKITLQAKKNGKAAVTVTMKSGAKAVCKITVNNKKVTTKKLTLNKKKAVVKAGKTVKLSVNRFPINGSEKIRWSTSNKKVAEVYKGRVKAKKNGKAVIKARTSNGKTAKCVITVTK